MAYVEEVQKRLLPDRNETYQQFLKLFSDYIGGKSLEQMKTEIRELFVDDPELVEGFEGFLPDRNLEQGVDKGVEGDTVL